MSYSSIAPLKDRVAIVTGGSGGIGQETSKALLKNGATVVMSDRNPERGQKVAHDFNNAGIARCVPSEECTDEVWQSVIDTNLSGVFYCCREFGKVMLAQGKGTIINMASMSGIISNVPQSQCAYNAAKAGVIMLTKSLAGEWAKRGVRVNSVSPGYVNTAMTPKDEIRRDWYDHWMTFSPMGRIAEPQEIAPAVVFLASDASSFVTGSNLVIDGGYSCW